jgi:hypothetical protein
MTNDPPFSAFLRCDPCPPLVLDILHALAEYSVMMLAARSVAYRYAYSTLTMGRRRRRVRMRG